MTVAGKAYPGTGNSPSVTWDGRGASGEVVDPGTYSATLIAKTEDGKCSDTKDISFTVTPPPDDQCGFMIVNFGSSAHVANGNLSHSQELFSARGIGPELGLTLFYNSLDPFNTSLGLGWSHDYDISLTQNSDGSVLLKEGNWRRRLYTLSGGSYSAQPQDYSTLVKNSDTTFTLTHKDGLKYTFNTDGTIASITDRNNNSVTFTYSGGRLTAVTDAANRTATLSHDGDGHLVTVTDPAGRNYTLGYSNGTLANVLYPDGGTWLFTYDDKAFLLTKTDPLGNLTTYAYDDKHRVVSATDTEGKTRAITYPVEGDTVKTTLFTEKDGGVWQYTYDTEKGTLNQKTDPQGGVTNYTYDVNGNRLSTTEPDDSTTSYTYDGQGNTTSVTDALGNTTGYTYNTLGQIASSTDPKGNTTAYTYDDKGNLASITDPAGAVTGYEYDAKGNVTKTTNPLGRATTFTYDTFGNLASTTDSSGAKTSFTYDAAGNMLTLTDAKGAVTRFEYNAKNRIIKTIDPNGNATSYAYDLAGNRISGTDANGNTTFYEYNAQGQVTKIRDALGNTTIYTYASSGCPSCGGGVDKLTALTDPNGNFTSYQYDTLGKLVKETDPLDSATSYSYDARGNPVSRTDANGNTITYRYDALGRLITKAYPDATEETFTHDERGNILTASNKNITYTFAYDPSNRMLSATDSNNRTIRYEYDLLGNRTKTTTPDGQVISYAHDAADRLAAITSGDKTFTFGYDTPGRRKKLTYPSGAFTDYDYDTAGRLTRLTHKSANGRVLDSFGYTHDKVGNRLTKTEPDGTTSYGYDAIYRLLSAIPYRFSGKETETFSYDPVGNRLTGPNEQLSYLYNQGNQLTAATTQTHNHPKHGHGENAKTDYTYDKNGNLTKKEEPSRSSRDKTTTLYSYDFENRLTKVEIQRGHRRKVVTFTYDPFGRRLSKAVHREELEEDEEQREEGPGCDDERHAPRTTYYLYDNEDIIAEYDDKGETTVRYLHGPGIDEPLAMERKGKVYYYHADGLSSITALTDRHGHVARQYDYDSFGNMSAKQNQFGQPYTYTAREWDKETGLYYYRARYYDPMAGRFISKDPIGFAGGDVNLYGYVSNNPINLTDPEGTNPLYCVKAIYDCAGKCAAKVQPCKEKHKDISVCEERGETIQGGSADSHNLTECYAKIPECQACVEDLISCYQFTFPKTTPLYPGK